MEVGTLLEQSLSKGFKSYDDLIDFLELKMVEQLDMIEIPVNHRVTEGMYTREAYAPAQTLLTSMRHKTDHQFIISKGSVIVFTDGLGWNRMDAPFHGETKKGTRRLIYVLDDVVWTSLHPTDKTDVSEIEQDLVEYNNKLLIHNI